MTASETASSFGVFGLDSEVGRREVRGFVSGSETGFPDSGPRESSQLRDRVQGRVGASARLQVLPRDQEIVARKTPDEQN